VQTAVECAYDLVYRRQSPISRHPDDPHDTRVFETQTLSKLCLRSEHHTDDRMHHAGVTYE
jgi:hypothetical protein